jgi:hypothetical protein
MYQRYVERIHAVDQEIWRKIASTQLETELLRLKQSLEDTYCDHTNYDSDSQDW